MSMRFSAFWKALLFGATWTALFFLGSMTGPERASSSSSPQQAVPVNPAWHSPADLGAGQPAIAPFVEKGLAWLVKAQHMNGGWGAGSHTAQQIRDPHRVQTDPATTAFVGLALLRAGHTPNSGRYRMAARRALHYLIAAVETSPANTPMITNLNGTQLQSKLGRYIDTSMTAQYLSRVLMVLPPQDKLRGSVDVALDKCLRKLSLVQNRDGSADGGGWAPVLQSSSSLNAMELAKAAGKEVDESLLANARNYQRDSFSAETGRVVTKSGANVELYAFAGAQRAAATLAKGAADMIAKGKREGKLSQDARVDEANLAALGVENAAEIAQAYDQVAAQNERIANDENLLRGFGSNGGEEFLSYLMASESLVLTGGPQWEEWNRKMHRRLAVIQNPDGSWSGHHCITSPVFCTAAVIQCLTAERDAETLQKIAAM